MSAKLKCDIEGHESSCEGSNRVRNVTTAIMGITNFELCNVSSLDPLLMLTSCKNKPAIC